MAIVIIEQFVTMCDKFAGYDAFIDLSLIHILFSACDTVQTDKTECGICFTFTVSKMWVTEDAE